MKQADTIKPMPVWLSLMYFGIPSLIASLGIYVGILTSNQADVALFPNFCFSLLVH
jgi:hypothetical protein